MSSDDVFWRGLVAAKQRAEELAPAERQEVERQLDEARRAAVPMTPEEISAMVQRAVAAPSIGRVRSGTFAALQRWLVAAAVVLIAHQLIVAGTHMSGAGMKNLQLRHTTKTMTFQEAISVVVDEEQEYKNRELAQASLYVWLIDGIRAARQVADEHGELGARAAAILARLQAAMTDAPRLGARRLPGSWPDLYAAVKDAGSLAADREQALDRLGDLMLEGLAALQAVAVRTDAPEMLKANTAYVLEHIRREL